LLSIGLTVLGLWQSVTGVYPDEDEEEKNDQEIDENNNNNGVQNPDNSGVSLLPLQNRAYENL
jgi:hypothetical protein